MNRIIQDQPKAASFPAAVERADRREKQKDCAPKHAAMKQDGWKNCWWCGKPLVESATKPAKEQR